MTSSLNATEFVVRSIAEEALVNEKYFGELDSVVGDGDFGYSLARGFEVVLSGWDGVDRTDPGVFLSKIAIVITSTIGGTSGPLWGTAFLRAGTALKGRNEISPADTITALRAAIEGIKYRGKSDVGDKTLLDAFVPAVDTLEAAFAAGDDAKTALGKMAVSAREAAQATSLLQARRGRASYTGERSVGSPDAGAIAIAVLVERLARTWAN
ncbi:MULTISPECIES: dihydroxyacetone kinase subunit DhaL [Cryobacterium]|uniref:Dihydroxyacetone kinase subunit L n=1 Tax=Cryobacterium levicorallinum TaxID=995038 RepID=A0A1I2Y1M9_9MICO|nr:MULTISPECIES: dihydroxyacetone kinase subunit DhaL [Cryobacterium]TFB85111.1 dihydroxyacetone kinase subunit L [Cryobacterium levicorallinum]TFD07694.1 dihydroxyacetone kinase subunit L [Cryobacterium sp. TMT1-66-1]TFD62481.1 dihydroxyacetone kinase subunit L [Cryobacterium sp. Hh38]SFH19650.1 dihydroxyacetone kinase, C-terminal domain [Cryobacterium levicorallinum]GEP27376.1 dihydroxyacetone kinase subunit L [Cryobacterium levicorallinum]